MPWVRVDDRFDEHPKLARVGPLGWGVWLAGLAYCNRNLTDGFIPRASARRLADFEFELDGETYQLAVTAGMGGTDLSPDWVINLLLEAALWEEVKGGYRVHDYHEYQPSKERVLAERQKNAKRQEKFRNGVTPSVTDAVSNASSNGTCNEAVTGAPVPVPKPVPNSKVNTNAELRSAVLECFAFWQERCNHQQAQLDGKRRRTVETCLKARQRHHSGDLQQAVLDVRQAIDGAAVGAYVNEQGKRFDDIELICRNVAKLEDFMARRDAKPSLRVVGHAVQDIAPERRARMREVDEATRRRFAQPEAEEQPA